MAEQQKKYVDPNAYAGYGAAMAPVAGDPMAVEWQKTDAARLAEATAPKALAAHVQDAAAAGRLLAKVQGAYRTDPLTLAVIGAVSQHVMEAAVGRAPGAAPCPQEIWNQALLAAFRKTKDAYVQTFLLDQLRWCGGRGREKDVRALKAQAADAHVKAYIDWAADEIAGARLPADARGEEK